MNICTMPAVAPEYIHFAELFFVFPAGEYAAFQSGKVNGASAINIEPAIESYKKIINENLFTTNWSIIYR